MSLSQRQDVWGCPKIGWLCESLLVCHNVVVDMYITCPWQNPGLHRNCLTVGLPKTQPKRRQFLMDELTPSCFWEAESSKTRLCRLILLVGRWDHWLTLSQCLLQLYALTVYASSKVHFSSLVLYGAGIHGQFNLATGPQWLKPRLLLLAVSDFIRSNLKTL